MNLFFSDVNHVMNIGLHGWGSTRGAPVMYVKYDVWTNRR